MMKNGYKQLTFHEPEPISIVKVSNKSIREIGRLLGKSPSTSQFLEFQELME
jgi:IS30 family transposase